jgi:signal transduction histidine kinase
MPTSKNEMLNVVEVTNLSLEIFTEGYIRFTPKSNEIIAKFDRTQLIRIITNLVKNAIQAVSEIEDPKINIHVFEEKNNVIIAVNDNGYGIIEANKAKVFEPKFTTKSSGMGLGLAMVKNIVETYNGSITFTSQQNEGTTFKVSFPKS